MVGVVNKGFQSREAFDLHDDFCLINKE